MVKEKYQALFKIIQDDLKDSKMFINYAWEVKKEDPATADLLIKEADTRLKHFDSFHTLLQQELGKISEKTDCAEKILWEESDKSFLYWKKELEDAIKDYMAK